MTTSTATLFVSSRAELRLQFALDTLRALPARGEALLLVPSRAAGTQLLARLLRPGEARFGWRQRTFYVLARELALPELARERRVPLTGLAVEALVTRVVHELADSAGLGRYSELAQRPGFVTALAKTLDELRLARVDAERLHAHAPELADVLAAYRRALDSQALADRTHLLDAALRALRARPPQQVPLLALDVPLLHAAEALLAEALCGERALACATVVRGDERSQVHWHRALDFSLARAGSVPGRSVQQVSSEPSADEGGSDLTRLQARLFEPSRALRKPTDALRSRAGEPRASPSLAGDRDRALGGLGATHGAVHIVSSPGEAREAVEVARGLAEAAARGVPFDRMAVVLRAVESYRSVVEEALSRADIPAHFADGVRRPLPEGRAFLALLACKRDGLSALSFAEYLSLGAMPRADGEEAPATPRQWERMLVEAAVIGGDRARWSRRIAGLCAELSDERASLDQDDPRRELLARDVQLLASLDTFAQPILEILDRLPEGGSWADWLAVLAQLARVSLRAPERVLELLAELAPLSPIGGVTIRSVSRVLSPRLSSVVETSSGHGAGKVFVGAIDDVRGRAFELVFVTGLAERVFPPRIAEDALLPDSVRRRLGPELWLTEERVARERLLLRIAVGAANDQLVLSFPRFDLAHGRPRVPSFYGLEVLQAIDGSLPAFDELTRRAFPGAAARMGFPAPLSAEQAIDDAEYDLAMLDRLIRAPEGAARKGAARYLLEANAHLARALRFRARRWELPRFSPADGFVAVDAAGKALLAPHRLSARPYSATALAQFALCPYRFFLYAIVGVAERPEVFAADELDARQRGVLFHRVLRAVLSELASEGKLPITPASLSEAKAHLTRTFALWAARARDDYAPSIGGVFETSLSAIARDLHEWLEHQPLEKVFVPERFELGFGLRKGNELDRTSAHEPVRLAPGLLLTGAIDLVERAGFKTEGDRKLLRATDYKTSAVPDKLGIVSGGRVLQPLLYALALEQLFPEDRVSSGRLYFCTSRGEYTSHEVNLDGQARAVMGDLVHSIDAMIEQGFLPAAPAPLPEDREKFACEQCAYRPVCGPYEAERVGAVKSRELSRLSPLFKVRGLP